MNSPTSVLDLIGNTPILEVTKFDTGPCELFIKLENQNPSGSIKDRTAKAMIDTAEQEGNLEAGDTIIEATSGNTGLGLSLIAAHKGYPLILVVPENISRDKVLHLKALGAEVLLARSDVESSHADYYRNIAKRLEKELPSGLYLDQFNNPANPLAHEQGTAPEMWEQMEQRMDALVCGVGSGGTLTGCARFLKKVKPDLEIVLADPAGSVLADSINPQEIPSVPGPSLIKDVGSHVVPGNFDPSVVDCTYTVPDMEAFSTARELLRREGVFGGVSSGLHLAAALRYCREQTQVKRVVTLVCDTGYRYLSTAYDRAWLLDQGLVPQQKYGDLRDLITRRADEGDVVSVTPDDTLIAAYTRIRMYDVSQLPVLKNGRIVGMIDESDLLMAVFDNREYFEYPVRDFMITRLETIEPNASITSLLPVFRGDHVAIIADKEKFYGLITQVDLINHLRNSMHNHT